MKPTVKHLIADEHEAVKNYGKAAEKSDPKSASVFKHIQGEEQHHAEELKKLDNNDKESMGPEGSEERAGLETVSSVHNDGHVCDAQPVVDAGCESGVGHWEGDGDKVKFHKV